MGPAVAGSDMLFLCLWIGLSVYKWSVFVFLLESIINLWYLYIIFVIFVDKIYFLPYTKNKPMQILEEYLQLRFRGIKPVLYTQKCICEIFSNGCKVKFYLRGIRHEEVS